MNTITWNLKSLKQLRKIEHQAQKTIRDGVNRLANYPETNADVISLTNHQYPYRLRVGDYRVFFSFDGKIRIITIEEVKRRNEQTY